MTYCTFFGGKMDGQVIDIPPEITNVHSVDHSTVVSEAYLRSAMSTEGFPAVLTHVYVRSSESTFRLGNEVEVAAWEAARREALERLARDERAAKDEAERLRLESVALVRAKLDGSDHPLVSALAELHQDEHGHCSECGGWDGGDYWHDELCDGCWPCRTLNVVLDHVDGGA